MARLVAVAQETLAVVPDIRMEKVEAIKSRMDADSYNPDGEAVAEGLIKEHLAKGRHS
jgi:anti-sigma28 factor (negative regulator of flagellin synthesis)